MQIHFAKLSAAGNDFVLIDNLDGRLSLDWASVARQLCNRRRGVGSDGLLVLESIPSADFEMLYYNADGSSGGMCGNGGRAVAHFYNEKVGPSRPIEFLCLGHTYSAGSYDEMIGLQMIQPRIIRTCDVLETKLGNFRGVWVDSGAPHLVVDFQENSAILGHAYDEIDVNSFGKTLRHHSAFQPGGINVDFVQATGISSVMMRTYERGVEEETLACGTGAVAVATAFSLLHQFTSPISITTRGGDVLIVQFDRVGEELRNVVLLGPTTIVFHGSLEFDPQTHSIMGKEPMSFGR